MGIIKLAIFVVLLGVGYLFVFDKNRFETLKDGASQFLKKPLLN